MRKLQLIGNSIVSLVLIFLALVLIAEPENGYQFVVVVLTLALVIFGFRYLIFYFFMGRKMVGGKSLLYRAIIAIDFAAFTMSLNDIPLTYVMLYLLAVHAIYGVIALLHALEMKRSGSPGWRIGMIYAVGNLVLSVLCLIFIGKLETAVYIYAVSIIYSALHRIVTALQPREMVAIQP